MRIVQIWGSEHCSGEELLFPHLFTDIHKGMTKKHKKHGLIFLFEIFYMCSCWEKAVKNKSKTGHQPEGQMSPQSSWSSSSPSPPRCWSASLAVALQLESWSSYLKTATISSLLWDRTPPSPPQVLREDQPDQHGEGACWTPFNKIRRTWGSLTLRTPVQQQYHATSGLWNMTLATTFSSSPYLSSQGSSLPSVGSPCRWWRWSMTLLEASITLCTSTVTDLQRSGWQKNPFVSLMTFMAVREPNKGDTSGIASHLIDIIWNNGS